MLARPFRLTRGDDYRRVVRSGTRAGGAHLLVSLVVSEEQRPGRCGFIVSKAVGSAVVRNRVRRRLKAITFGILPRIPDGTDLVIRAHPSAATASFSVLEEEVIRCLERALRQTRGSS